MAGQEQDDPERELFDAMTKLWHRAGCPSARAMARDIGGLSHSTAHAAINGPSVPSWPVLVSVIEHLNGDPDKVKPLWMAVQVGRSGPGAATFPGQGRVEGYRLIADAIREGLAEIAAAIREQGKPGG